MIFDCNAKQANTFASQSQEYKINESCECVEMGRWIDKNSKELVGKQPFSGEVCYGVGKMHEM